MYDLELNFSIHGFEFNYYLTHYSGENVSMKLHRVIFLESMIDGIA